MHLINKTSNATFWLKVSHTFVKRLNFVLHLTGGVKNYFNAKVQWKPLHVIMVNVISRLM
jgi:hypothetical protein